MKKIEFKASWYYAIKELPKETQFEIYTAILEYAFEGKDSGETLNPTGKAIFILIKSDIDYMYSFDNISLISRKK